MTQLSADLKKDGSNKHIHAIKAKKALMEILVSKTTEYLKHVEQSAIAEVISQLTRQYSFIID